MHRCTTSVIHLDFFLLLILYICNLLSNVNISVEHIWTVRTLSSTLITLCLLLHLLLSRFPLTTIPTDNNSL
ncbi:hypothetical protein BZA77DRAFT_328271 [Pyronema omphalodes]|nr:hypothetical protein BZA77DRAFT_328271 [Pyronema omphalodes]